MRRKVWLQCLIVVCIAGVLAACGQPPTGGSGAASSSVATEPFVISAIPDQDPEKLQRLYGTVATYLQGELGVPVEYKPVTDYTASITAFKVGDLQMVWYGGLTGTQARLQVPGAQAILQRDIDEQFHSVFIANKASGITSLEGLIGRSFTFGSESSTSGRLMPQFFLGEAGIKLTDFKGEPGFSGSHDKTIDLVAVGTYEAGALNEQVWKSRLAKKTVDLSKVDVFYTSPAFPDYHWVIHPDAITRYGADFVDKVQNAFFKLDPSVAAHQEILDLFGAQKFIATKNENYERIATVGRQIGLIVQP